MIPAGYYRYPTISGNTIVFVTEDDLWCVGAEGGVSRRLTTNPGVATRPALSPDGRLLAFTGHDEGPPEVFCMDAAGGPARRLTFLGADARVHGWLPGGQRIVFASNARQPFVSDYRLYTVSPEGDEPRMLPTGPAVSISFGPQGGAVIGRFASDIAHWKRYRGGQTGDLWLDDHGDGGWRRLVSLPGNVAAPLWIGERIYFVSDHEGVGNLYSCLVSGEDIRRHTHHADFYGRHPRTDGRRIVYHAGGDIFLFDPSTDEDRKVEIEHRSSRSRLKRRFVDAGRFLQDFAVHPEGHSVAVVTRGQTFTMANWEGAPIRIGAGEGVRHRMAAWLHDGRRVVLVSDASGEDRLEVHFADDGGECDRLVELDIGRPIAIWPSPTADRVAVANHRLELLLVDLPTRSMRVLDHSHYDVIYGASWSPDGRWLAYGFATSRQTSLIRLCEVDAESCHDVTSPVLNDISPAFDPDGKYLYFVSYREFNPVYDSLHFELSFPRGSRPYLVTLQADEPSPFVPQPRPPGAKAPAPRRRSTGPDDGEPEAAGGGAATDGTRTGGAREPVRIDLEGIRDRVVAFPVPEGRYGTIRGISGQALFTNAPIAGALSRGRDDGSPRSWLESYRFDDQSHQTLIHDLSSFEVSADARTLVYRAGGRLRMLKAGDKPESGEPAPGRRSGWLDLSRIRVSVHAGQEWAQMFREAWRLQRDQFWTADMSGVDWQLVFERYFPLLERVSMRSEFSDLLWEMQGELATSHAYEYGGDYRPDPAYHIGFLGADLAYDRATDSYRVERILRGDPWDETCSSPLGRPGMDARDGDRLIAIGGQRTGKTVPPGALLVNQAGTEVALSLVRGDAARSHTVTVRTLESERHLRYREWVEANRRMVHQGTGGRVGYVHVPDMGPSGYAEFHRGFLTEIDRVGLIVDVRFNTGGNVSQLLLEKLARRRLGYDVQRWGAPIPYPYESVLGPLVALINEQTGSDGDMFSHAFKVMGLGPLIGTRTWGGVIGINRRNSLVDGGTTTQPEYSFWFQDVAWDLENYGVEPDIEVVNAPQDYVAGRDPQLERAVEEVLSRMAANAPRLPDFGNRPLRTLPLLPGVPPAPDVPQPAEPTDAPRGGSDGIDDGFADEAAADMAGDAGWIGPDGSRS